LSVFGPEDLGPGQDGAFEPDPPRECSLCGELTDLSTCPECGEYTVELTGAVWDGPST
jgi:hypothetical protein